MISQNTDFKRDEPSVISFLCPQTEQEYALSFKSQNSAQFFWAELQTVLAEVSKRPEQRIPVPNIRNIKEVIEYLQANELQYILLMKSKLHFFGLIQTFEETEKIFATFDGENENAEQNLLAYHAIQFLLKIVYSLRKFVCLGLSNRNHKKSSD